MVVSWPRAEARDRGRITKGQANARARSVASDPWSVCAWWVFFERGVSALVLHFSIICDVQLKFPEGRTENRPTGPPRAPWSFTSQFWHAAGFSPLSLEVQDKAGHKSHERRGRAQFRREKERCLCCFCTSTYTKPNQTFTPHRGSCPLSLDIYPSPRGDLCTDERKWVTCRESTSMSHGLEFV